MTTTPIGFECAEFSDAYKAEYDFRPSARECEWFLALSHADKTKELDRLGGSVMPSQEEQDRFLGLGEIWSAATLLTEKLASHPEFLTEELFLAVLGAKARNEEAEQAQRDAWSS
jgi:hypothetical protein